MTRLDALQRERRNSDDPLGILDYLKILSGLENGDVGQFYMYVKSRESREKSYKKVIERETQWGSSSTNVPVWSEQEEEEMPDVLANLPGAEPPDEESQECEICCENKRNAVLHCGHAFCGPCIRNFQGKCAVCRKKIAGYLNLFL